MRETASIRQKEKSRKKIQEARDTYEERWVKLLEQKSAASVTSAILTFSDIPWPIYPLREEEVSEKSIDEIVTTEAISSFFSNKPS